MKTIYSLWFQGYENAPDLVKVCLDRWCKLNPTYTFKLLEKSDVDSLLANLPFETVDITQQSLSDVVRLALLHKTGGVWVDATVFPVRPLSEWLEETVIDSEFFSYRREIQLEPPKNRPISAWFLYAAENSVIIDKLWKETLRYWSFEHYQMSDSDKNKYQEDPIGFMGLSQEIPNKPYPYHWFQHVFAYLLKNDPSFRKIWCSCPSKSMTIPHKVQFWTREELVNKNAIGYLTEKRIKDIIENSEMHKLNWRMKFPIETMKKYSVNNIN